MRTIKYYKFDQIDCCLYMFSTDGDVIHGNMSTIEEAKNLYNDEYQKRTVNTEYWTEITKNEFLAAKLERL